MWSRLSTDASFAVTGPLAVDEHGASVLHHAAKRGSVQVLEAVIPLATTPSHSLHPLTGLRTLGGASPLHVAAYHGQLAALKVFLSTPLYRAEINCRDCWRQTPLHYAAIGGSVEVIEALAAAGASVEAQDERGATPLQFAAAAGHAAAVRALIALGGNANSKDWREARPIHYAAGHARASTLSALLEANAALDAKDKEHFSVLHYGALGGSLETLALVAPTSPAELLTAPTAKYSSTMLHAAAAGGSEALINDILTRVGDAALRVPNAHGALPIHLAAARGRTRAVALLLSRAPDTLEAADASRATPLLKAAFSGSVTLVQLLLDRGASTEVLDDEGAGVLHKAAWSGSHDTVALLLDSRAALVAQLALGDAQGATPLHKAAYKGHAKTVQLLVKRGAAINAKDVTGGQAVHNAACKGHFAALKALLEQSRPPRLDLANAQDASGRTPMHFAAASGRSELIELLRLYGGDVNAATKEGRSPLYYAFRRSHDTCLAQLLLLGAQFSRKDRQALSVSEMRSLHGLVRADSLPALLKNARALATASASAAAVAASSSPLSSSSQGISSPPPKRRISRVGSRVATPSAINKRASVLFKGDGLTPEAARAKAVEAFNTRPKAGITAAMNVGVIGHSPGDVARFLFGTPGLDKVKIGEYLGEMDEFPQEVLAAFVAQIDFTHLDLDIALRRMLTKFRLPGEAQKIDRIMQKFARQYYSDNSEAGLFASSDAVYVLAFATIMLNTDAHNPAVKKENKMRKDQFVLNSKGHNGRGDWPTEYLEDLYTRIVEEEIKMEVDRLALPTAVMKAWLQLSNNKKEKKAVKRLVVLTEDPALVVFVKSTTDEPPAVSIPLKGVQLTKDSSKKYLLRLECPHDARVSEKPRKEKEHKDKHEATVWQLQASSEVEFNNWARALTDFTKPNKSRRTGGA